MNYYVEQREKSDCVIATIAMFTRLSYERVLDVAGERYTPNKGTHSVGDILRELGFKQANYIGNNNGDGRAFKTLWKPFELSSGALRNWMWGRECMFSVPSKNIEDGWHMIYYDGQHIYDPIPVTREGKKRYELDSFETIEPRDAYVWQEIINDV